MASQAFQSASGDAVVGLGIQMEDPLPTSIFAASLRAPEGSTTRLPTISIPFPKDHDVSNNPNSRIRGLLLAENGASMVEFDQTCSGRSGSAFRQGHTIAPGCVTPGGSSRPRAKSSVNPESYTGWEDRSIQPPTQDPVLQSRKNSPHRRTTNPDESHSLHDYLDHVRPFSSGKENRIPPQKSSASRPSSSSGSVHTRSKLTAAHRSTSSPDLRTLSDVLTSPKSRAKVEVDLFLERDTFVEGGNVRGTMEIMVAKSEKPVWIGHVKVRMVGFEAIHESQDRHIFCQYMKPLSTISSSSHLLYASASNEKGFHPACEGTHLIPFAMNLPIGTGAKGAMQGGKVGAEVRYIILGSVKIYNPDTQPATTMTHFYRYCVIYPYLNPAMVLAPAPAPFRADEAKSIFLGGNGKLRLEAILYRQCWVAGQECRVRTVVENRTTKKVRTVTLTLFRITTVYRPNRALDPSSPGGVDFDACQTTTTRKQINEVYMEAGARRARGQVTAKGWWTGIESGDCGEHEHSILIPPDALSISRGRLMGVEHVLRVSVGAGSLSSDVHVEIPLRIINFHSIDPPLAPNETPSLRVPRPPPSANQPPQSMSDPIHDRAGDGSRFIHKVQSRPAIRRPRTAPAEPPQLPQPESQPQPVDVRPLQVRKRTRSVTFRPEVELIHPEPEAPHEKSPGVEMAPLRGNADEPPTEESQIVDTKEDSQVHEKADEVQLFASPEAIGGVDLGDDSDDEEEVQFVIGSAKLDGDDGENAERFQDADPLLKFPPHLLPLRQETESAESVPAEVQAETPSTPPHDIPSQASPGLESPRASPRGTPNQVEVFPSRESPKALPSVFSRFRHSPSVVKSRSLEFQAIAERSPAVRPASYSSHSASSSPAYEDKKRIEATPESASAPFKYKALPSDDTMNLDFGVSMGTANFTPRPAYERFGRPITSYDSSTPGSSVTSSPSSKGSVGIRQRPLPPIPTRSQIIFDSTRIPSIRSSTSMSVKDMIAAFENRGY
ncbi:hypothetical protein BOTBODRAFT_53009 [Botryobasidium botryosum FD-172 SS1]|uniref:Arrestin C-terminal-like domain-containing protein n=1 Tax=Botryobasidium botryosum (strain FD-172 SS1) TaxID=930990 RepID=A0A067N377_BOTB1|nr:hypothetical protein BOTBODRAFT_53009 [Botryobasidium botryosum FD-172 SS1]